MPPETTSTSSTLTVNTAWMLSARLGQRVLGIISTIILARLLIPDDFGLVALATAIIAVIEVFGQFGFDLALIRDHRATRDDYDTAWTLNIISGAIFAGILLVLAWPIAFVFNDARLGHVVMWLSIRPVIEGFHNIGIVDFRKNMMMHREFRLFLTSKLFSLLLVIPLAFLWRSYGALIVGIISEQVARLILSYYLHQFRPRFCLAKWRELFAFSKWVLSSEIIFAIGNRMDTFVVGKWGSPHDVGIYNVAYEISNLPTTELVWPIGRVVFPAYAKIASDAQAVTAAYLKAQSVIFGIGSPLACGIAATASLLVPIMFGEKWLDAIPIIQALAVFGFIRILLSTDGPLLIALNRPNVVAILDLSEVSLRIPLLFVGMATYGLLGIAGVLIATCSVRILANQIVVGSLLALSLGARILVVWRTLLANAAMIGVVWFTMAAWGRPETFFGLALEALFVSLVGAVTYAAALLILWQFSGRPDGVESFVISNIKRILRAGPASKWET